MGRLAAVPLASVALAAVAAGALYKQNFDGATPQKWTGKHVRGRDAYGGRGGCFEARTDTGNSYFRCVCATPAEYSKGLYSTGPDTYVCFSYWQEKARDFKIQMGNSTLGENVSAHVSNTVPQFWRTVAIPMKDFGKLKANQRITSMQFYCGSPKEPPFRCLIDNVLVTRGRPVEALQRIAYENRLLKNFTLTLADDCMVLNRGMILELQKAYKPPERGMKKSIAIVGDSLAESERFFTRTSKVTSCKFLDRSETTKAGLTAEEAAAKVKGLVSGERPEVIVIFLGYDESRAAVKNRDEVMKQAKEEAEKLKAAAKDAKEAKKIRPRSPDQILRERVKKHLAELARTALDAGTIPIFIVFPPPAGGRRSRGIRIIDSEYTSYMGTIGGGAVDMSCPVIDCQKLFEKLRRKKGALVSSYGVKKQGYSELNKLIVRMYKILEKEIFKKKRK